MKGLLVKDCRILMNNKRLIFIVLMCTVAMVFLGGSEDALTTASGMFIFLLGNIAVSTISYDDFDKGMGYIMTLPYKRKTYVIEKYFLTVLCMLIGVVMSIIATIILSNDYLYFTSVISCCVLMVMLIAQSVAIPLYLKYGVEKGRIYAFVGYGIIAAVVYAFTMFSDRLFDFLDTLNNPIIDFFYFIMEADDIVWVSAGLIGSLIIYIISMLISIRIMKRKEF